MSKNKLPTIKEIEKEFNRKWKDSHGFAPTTGKFPEPQGIKDFYSQKIVEILEYLKEDITENLAEWSGIVLKRRNDNSTLLSGDFYNGCLDGASRISGLTKSLIDEIKGKNL